MRIEPRQPQAYERKDVVKEVTGKPLPRFAPAPAGGPGVPFTKSDGCMWPLWGIESSIGNVCGEEQLVLDKGTKRERVASYCPVHHRRAYPSVRR